MHLCGLSFQKVAPFSPIQIPSTGPVAWKPGRHVYTLTSFTKVPPVLSTTAFVTAGAASHAENKNGVLCLISGLKYKLLTAYVEIG